MSHFSKIKTQINNKEVLLQTLETMGLKAEVHEKATRLSTVFRGNEMADIVVSKEQIHAMSDMGFVQNQDGVYEVVFDPYCWGHTTLGQTHQTYDDFTKALDMNYQVQLIQNLYGDSYFIEQTQNEDGSIGLGLSSRW